MTLFAATVAGLAALAGAWNPAKATFNKTGWRNVLRTVPGSILNVTVVLLIAAIALPAWGAVTGNHRLVPVLSGSMEPHLNVGDAAWLKRTPIEDVQVGDVITFIAPDTAPGRLAGEPVIHRVDAILDPADMADPIDGHVYIQTRGDNLSNPDPWILDLDVDAVMVQDTSIPKVGHLVNWASNPNVKKWVIVGFALVLVAYGAQTLRDSTRTQTVTEPGGRARQRPATARPAGTSSWRPAAAAAAIFTTIAATSGAYAAYSDTETSTATLDSGVVALSINEGTNRLTVTYSGLLPNETVQRAVDLQHIGTIDLYGAGPNDPAGAVGLQVETADPSASPLTTNQSDGLQLEIVHCTSPWTETVLPGPEYSYVCDATETTVVPSQPILGIADLPSAVMQSYQPGGIDHLVVNVTLPASAPASFEAETVTVSFDFDGIQRDGITQP